MEVGQHRDRELRKTLVSITKRKSSLLFVDDALNEALSKAFFSKIAEIHRNATAEIIPTANINFFYHGEKHVRPQDDLYFDGGTRSISTKLTLKYEDLADNKLSVIAAMLDSMRTSVTHQFAQNMFAVVGDASESVGNVVDAKIEGSMFAALKQMWEKIEIIVDSDLNPKLPIMYCGSDAFKAFQKFELESSQEVKDAIEAIKNRKIDEARTRELARQARFLKYGDSQ